MFFFIPCLLAGFGNIYGRCRQLSFNGAMLAIFGTLIGYTILELSDTRVDSHLKLKQKDLI